MELYYIGFIDWFRDNPYLMYVSTAIVKEREKTYKIEGWKTDYPTFEVNNETFFNPEKLSVLKEVKKPYQIIFKKSELEHVTKIGNGYLGKSKVEILETISQKLENNIFRIIEKDIIVTEFKSLTYCLQQVNAELVKEKQNTKE